MADSTIGGLPLATQLSDNSLIAVEQQGVAHRFTGAQFKEFGKQAVNIYVNQAKDEADRAKGEADRAKGEADRADREADRAEQAVVDAKDYSIKPAIPKNGTWWIWNAETKQYEDTGEKSEGDLLYATFSIVPETGMLWMNKPRFYDGPEFSLNNDGFLEVHVHA